MGGFGSGRSGSGKRCTGDRRALDIRHLHRTGVMKPGRSCQLDWQRNGASVAAIVIRVNEWSVTLDYQQRQHDGDWQAMRYNVPLTRTPCHLGGERVWWECPASGCARRVAVLYAGSGIFACRHCYRLAYRSQRETPDSRAIRRADKLRARLDWTPGIALGHGGKPKGMHWRTYSRLTAEYHATALMAFAGLDRQIGVLRGRLGEM